VIDQLSGGRLVLGVAQGGREDDYEALGAEFAGRSTRFERQVGRIREIWERARASDRDHGLLGPAPLQEPAPPIWAGASTPKSIERAARVADGYIFGTSDAAAMEARTPAVREAFAVAGKPDATVAALAYVAVGDDAEKALDEATHNVLRYYGRLWTEPGSLIHHGPAPKLAEEIASYEEAGIDVLVVVPQIARLDQVEQLAEHVLPAYTGSPLAV
jgi:alkanesulfonate monooxygenase SsuD/methylene tetrahydromethanopterin reductase-like flavin-dependent oxidoreductase (luciferase family)